MIPFVFRKLLGAWTGGGIAKWAEILAGAVIIFFAGMAYGEHNTTKTAIDAATQAVSHEDAKRFAAATGALATTITDGTRRVREAAVRERVADDHAVGSIAAERDAARRDLENAQRLLAAERAKRDAQPKKETADAVQAQRLPVAFDPCLFSGDVRRVLDHAAGADDGAGDPGAGGGSADPGAAGGSVAPATTTAEAPQLTCQQLAEGYAALGAWGREMLSGLRAWQQWYRDSFGIAPN